MKRVPKPVFFIVALLILAFSFTAIFGVSYYTGDNKNTVLKGIGDIRWGIDIRGGVEATFKPANNYDATDEQLESAKSIIELRMISQGITDYELYADRNSDRIIVRFPWKSDETEFNAVNAIEEISSTANLTFRPGKSYESTDVGSDGEYIYKTPTGDTATVLMDGSAVEKAEAQYYQDDSGKAQYVVSLTLNEEGAKTFQEITTTYLNQTVSIWMDDIMLSAPTVQATITDGKAQISGSFTAKQATELAQKINAGALPFQLRGGCRLYPHCSDHDYFLPSPRFCSDHRSYRSDGSYRCGGFGLFPRIPVLYNDSARYCGYDPLHRYGR